MFGAKSPAVEELLAEIDRVRVQLPKTHPADELARLHLGKIGRDLLDSLAKQVKAWSKAEAEDYEAAVRSHPHDPNFTPFAYVANYLVHATGDQLESGHHHVYRGVLSNVGHAYEAILDFAVDSMVRRGAYTQDWAESQLLGPIRRGIASMG